MVSFPAPSYVSPNIGQPGDVPSTQKPDDEDDEDEGGLC